MARPVRQNRFPTGPSELVASYATYEEAQRAVDFAADRRFPVERLAIVAGDLRLVEQVTGREGYGTAALNGAASGAITGVFIGFILGLFSLLTPLTSGVTLALWGLVIGAVVGALVGLLVHVLAGGRRDFSSVSQIVATRYEVLVEHKHAAQGRELLARMPGNPQQIF